MFKGPNAESIIKKNSTVADWVQPLRDITALDFSSLYLQLYHPLRSLKHELDKVVNRNEQHGLKLIEPKDEDNIKEEGYEISYQNTICLSTPIPQTIDCRYKFGIRQEYFKRTYFCIITYNLSLCRVVESFEDRNYVFEKIIPDPYTMIFDPTIDPLFNNESYRYYLNKYMCKPTTIRNAVSSPLYNINLNELKWALNV